MSIYYSPIELASEEGIHFVMPDTELINILSDNNTELKILSKAPLLLEREMILSKIFEVMIESCDEDVSDVLNATVVASTVSKMNKRFIDIDYKDYGKVARITEEGIRISAAIGGHLLELAYLSDIPLRQLVGEHMPPRLRSTGYLGRGSIEGRAHILTTLWDVTRNEWLPATELLNNLKGKGLHEVQIRKQIKKLRKSGIVERRSPNPLNIEENSVRGYLYRINQEEAPFPALKTVERYLSILLMTSVNDEQFVESGLDKLRIISSNGPAHTKLIRNSFVTNHFGKRFKNS